jgi:hypothetical protein
VHFEEDEIERLMTESRGHPAELQGACSALYEARTGGRGTGGFGTSSTFASDAAQKQDWLWDGVYSEALADFIEHRETRPPLVIGINAPWGAGKSSLMKAIRHRVDSKHDQPPDDTAPTLWRFWRQLSKSDGKDDGAPARDSSADDPAPREEEAAEGVSCCRVSCNSVPTIPH